MPVCQQGGLVYQVCTARDDRFDRRVKEERLGEAKLPKRG